jgi:hypothetical protein
MTADTFTELRSLASFVATQIDAPTFDAKDTLTHVFGRLQEIAAGLTPATPEPCRSNRPHEPHGACLGTAPEFPRER